MTRRFQSRAPARIDFGGGGTDCPPYCLDYEGQVINAAIRHYVFAQLETTPGSPDVHLASAEFGEDTLTRDRIGSDLSGPLGLLKGAIAWLRPDFGFRLRTESALPSGCGLSTSAAALAAVIAVVAKAAGRDLSGREIFEGCVHVERRMLAIPGGSQDQYAAAHGGVNAIRFHGDEAQGGPIPLSPGFRARLESNLFLIHTGEAHLSGNIHHDIRAAYADPSSTTRAAMHGLRDVAERMRACLIAEDIPGFATLLYENWRHHQGLHASCNSPRIESFYAILKKHRVAGAKTCGAGGGGCIVFYTEDARRDGLFRELAGAGGVLMPVQFDDEGAVAWECAGS